MNVAELLNSEGGANIALTINAHDLRNVVADIVRREHERATEEASMNNEVATITRFEAARLLNVTLSTLWHWDKEKYLQPVRIGKKVLYRKSDIESMLKKGVPR